MVSVEPTQTKDTATVEEEQVEIWFEGRENFV